MEKTQYCIVRCQFDIRSHKQFMIFFSMCLETTMKYHVAAIVNHTEINKKEQTKLT